MMPQNHLWSVIYLGFTHGAVPPVGLDQCVMTCVHQSIIQNIFSFFLSYIYSPPPPLPQAEPSGNHFTVSRMSHSWSCTGCCSFRLDSLTWQYACKSLPYFSMAHFHCLHEPQFIPSLIERHPGCFQVWAIYA